jgi:8-oxo-dGTP pyrophosphatase MutT (NUDIX family)
MKFYLCPFRGAGLAITTTDRNGTLHILLGRRLFNPGKHQWTFPGGKLHKNELSDTGALREAQEEVRLWSGNLSWPAVSELKKLWSSHLFDWTTWHWHVRNPKLLLPKNGRDVEFDCFGWFVLDNLPKPLHYGVRQAVRKLRRFKSPAAKTFGHEFLKAVLHPHDG